MLEHVRTKQPLYIYLIYFEVMIICVTWISFFVCWVFFVCLFVLLKGFIQVFWEPRTAKFCTQCLGIDHFTEANVRWNILCTECAEILMLTSGLFLEARFKQK